MSRTLIENQRYCFSDITALVCGGFRRAVSGTPRDYVMVREGCAFLSDETAWSEDEWGRWQGAPAPTVFPNNLTLDSASAITRDPATERDTVLRLGSGGAKTARWGLNYRDRVSGALTFAVKVWNAATGAVAFSGSVSGAFTSDATTLSLSVGALADGNYVLGCSVSAGEAKHMTFAQYATLVGNTVPAEYRYTEDDTTYFYDYRRNLGVRPSDPEHTLNVARAAVEAAGTQQDNPEWIQYATTHDTWSGEWSLRKFVVGAGTFSLGANVLCGPGACLFRANAGGNTTISSANRASYQRIFDPMARCLMAHFVATDGTRYIAGDRSTESGLETALWRLNSDDTATLLGTSPLLPTEMCECFGLMSAHTGRRIVEEFDGTIVVGTLCSDFRYDPFGEVIETRLVAYPRATAGHPGGRSMVVLGRKRVKTTEFFGQGGVTTGNAAQFYDTIYSSIGDGSSQQGVGTVCHVDGNLAFYKDGIRGIIQDKPFSKTDALQSVAMLTAAGWEPVDSMANYPASGVRLQRVARVGPYFLAYGKSAGDESPRGYATDGRLSQPYGSTHRFRQIDAVLNATGYETGFAPAFLPGDSFGGMRYPRRLIEIGDPSTGFLFEEETSPWDGDIHNAAEQLAAFGPGAVWFGEAFHIYGLVVSGICVGDRTVPATPSAIRPFTAEYLANAEDGNCMVWARVDSSADVDDLETYTYRVERLADLWMLPVPAAQRVDFEVIMPADAEHTKPLVMMAVC